MVILQGSFLRRAQLDRTRSYEKLSFWRNPSECISQRTLAATCCLELSQLESANRNSFDALPEGRDVPETTHTPESRKAFPSSAADPCFPPVSLQQPPPPPLERARPEVSATALPLLHRSLYPSVVFGICVCRRLHSRSGIWDAREEAWISRNEGHRRAQVRSVQKAAAPILVAELRSFLVVGREFTRGLARVDPRRWEARARGESREGGARRVGMGAVDPSVLLQGHFAAILMSRAWRIALGERRGI